MLPTNLTKSAIWLLPILVLNLSGCGLGQSVSDGTKSAVSSIFYKKIKVLHLDFVARADLNTDARENNSHPESVVIRVYQLRERKTFDKTVYQQLLKEGESLLGQDLLASRDVVLKPGSAVGLDMPMEADAKFVAVVALFRHPDSVKQGWKQVLDREQLDPDKARVFEAGANSLNPIAIEGE
ncbi:type VI secretion system lipoprotein TssJ [Erwinia sp. S38]|uniref:type VI secretion system lipoprotein TssJ n=1 Tax=Erwinia sp. S38 TaxID=2769338 RepID=UPI00190B2D75|nr:type VI secretion system lipoprotein TssJ [Erwinia sp. S38]